MRQHPQTAKPQSHAATPQPPATKPRAHAAKQQRKPAKQQKQRPQAAKQHPKGTVYGYARVSTRDQNLDRQLVALAAFPVEGRRVFADKASGKDFDRPAYRRLMARLRPGDVLVIKSIDRLGRDYNEILEQWRAITKHKRVDVVVLDMPLLDTRTTRNGITGVFLADVVLQLLSYVAQIERDNTRQRQAEGIAAARERGVRFGRPAIERPAHYGTVRDAVLRGVLSRASAAGQLGVSLSTLRRWMDQDEA